VTKLSYAGVSNLFEGYSGFGETENAVVSAAKTCELDPTSSLSTLKGLAFLALGGGDRVFGDRSRGGFGLHRHLDWCAFL